MENIIATFGIDVRLIVIQIINFAIVMAALWYFLYTPVLKLLREREQKIATGLKDAEEANQAKTAATAEKKTIITYAHKEAEAMLARAKEHVGMQTSEMLTNAQRQAEQVVKEAAARGRELKAAAVKESEAEIAKLAILAAEKVLKERIS